MRHWPIVAALGLTLACETAHAGEVKLLASGALREALEELLPEFERASVHEGEPVARLVSRGDVEIGFQQISEIIHVAGVDFVGPLPPDVQHITVFASGLAATATETDAAKALVRFLTGPAAGPVLKKHGLEPA